MLEAILALGLVIVVVAWLVQNVELEDARAQIAKMDRGGNGKIGGSLPKPRLVK
jgi:hypothetical protein